MTTNADGSETTTTTFPDGTQLVEKSHPDGHRTASMPAVSFSDAHPNQDELVAKYNTLRAGILRDWTTQTGQTPVPAPQPTLTPAPLPSGTPSPFPTPTVLPPDPSGDPTASPSPAPSAPGSSSYSFLARDADGPVTWTSCRALTYRVNPDQMPAGALVEVDAALNAASAATGLTFAYAGETTFVPWATSNPSSFDAADIIIAWSDDDHAPDLAGSVIGRGGVSWAPRSTPSSGQQMEMTSGMVLLDADFTPTSMSGPGASLRGLLLHEIGHALNLGHISDAAQVMNPTLSAVSPNAYGGGDLAGLAQVADRFDCS